MKVFTLLRILVFTLALICYGGYISGQSTGLYYSIPVPTFPVYTFNSAATVIFPAGTSNSVSAAIPIGFSFKFGGQPVTQVWVSSNGFAAFANPGGSLPTNNLATAPVPMVAPLWDSLKIAGPSGTVNYKFSGGNPNKVLKIEWTSVNWNNNATVDSAISFQLWLYQDSVGSVAPSRIEFRYNRVGTNLTGVHSPSSSIGLAGFCPGDFYADSASGGSATHIFSKLSDGANTSNKLVDDLLLQFNPVKHPNDWAASALVTPLMPNLPLQQYISTTLGSSRSTTVPQPACWGAADTFDIWFKVTKPSGITNFELFTDQADCRGAAYNPKIAVYTDTTALPVACDATNSGGVAGATSSLNLVSQPCASTVYYVRVGSAQRAYFRFNIRPPGRDCNYANTICGIPYASPPNLSTCGFGNDYDSTNSACHTPRQEGEDYLFVYTPLANACVNISLNNTPSNSYPGLTVYQGCPTTGNCLANVQGAGVSPVTFDNMSLVAGITYYFAVDYDANGGFVSCMNNFDLTITNSVSPTPAYDLCSAPAGPVPVTIGANCTGLVDYNNNCASPSSIGSVPLPGCGNFIEGVTPDVWLTFTSTSNQPHQVDVSPGTAPAAQDLAMAIYTSGGGSCGPFTLVNCDDNSNIGMPSLTVVPPAAGTVYYIRIWSNSGTQTGNFRICVLAGCSPANDLPCAAVPLTLGQPVNGDNACSSGAGEPASATCWGGGNTLNTVWYSFVATNTTMKVRTRLFTLYDSQIAVYSGTCGPGLVQIAAACNDNYTYNCGNSFTTKASDLTVNGLVIGATYYVAVDGRGSNTGTFEIIVIDGASTYPPVAVQDCALPINVCSNAAFTVADPGYSGAGNFCDVGSPAICMYAGESSSSWYTFSITGPATLQWVLTTSVSNDYDWMIWCVDTVWNNNPNHTFPTIPNYCSNLNNQNLFPWTSCNVSHIDNTGMGTSMGTDTVGGVLNQHRSTGGGSTPPLNQAGYIPAGMTATFLLSLNNWSNTTVGFNFNFQGSPINGNPPAMTWQNASTNVWSTRANWLPSSCGSVPDCINQIAATITSGGIQPIMSSNCTVKDITINAGASLTIQGGVVLSVCGNFTNNGALNCQPGSVVRFIGNSNTTINGTFGPALNNFYNVEFAKGAAAASVTLNTNIYIQGYDSIYGGNVINNNKNTEVGGNFYNYNGSTSFTGVGAGAGGSTLTFTRRSGANQNFRNDGVILTLNNVIMNQIAVGSLSLFNNATGNMIIGTSGVLTLTQGRIITGAREVNVTNSSNLACSAGNTNSYVDGDLRRAIQTAAFSYDFPVGDGISALAPGIVGFERINITFTTSPTVAYDLLAHFYRWTLGGVVFPGNGPAASECVTATYNALPTFDHGYWRITASTGSPTGTYRTTLYNQAMSNNSGSGWTVVKAVSGSGAFGLTGACFVASTANQTRRDNLTGFSDFATVQSQNPLPIQLLYFNAEAKGRDVVSSWTTSSEINNDHFELERSLDGNEFVKIAQVKGFGSGVSTQALHYGYDDKNACDAILYYRLKQVDIDGNHSYSRVAAVNCKDAANAISVYPNPANTILNVNFNVLADGNAEVQIMNMIGMIVMKKEMNAQSGLNSASFEIKDLPSGVYYLLVRDSGQNDPGRQVKFLKY